MPSFVLLNQNTTQITDKCPKTGQTPLLVKNPDSSRRNRTLKLHIRCRYIIQSQSNNVRP